jgi:ribosomal protein S27E
MSDRKYRQRGYQDDPREPRRDQQRPAEKKEYAPRGQPPVAPKTFNMPGFREVVRCARCGNELTVAAVWSPEARCTRCGADLHTCGQCVNFDTGAAFECQKPVRVRISPKDARNTCEFFEPRATIERETKSSSSGPPSARKAFDDLFK